jgi:divalent metal cation (Fe/Co/Zn/Cd) transporter
MAALHRWGVRLEWFTVAWNVVEAVVAVGVGIAVGSVALIGFGADSGIEVISAVALLWRLLKTGPHASVPEEGDAERKALYLVGATLALLLGVGLNAAFGWWWADPVGALAMVPVILWQGWEALGEAREGGEDAE